MCPDDASFSPNNKLVLRTIIQKSCEPGHSNIQEIGPVHIVIELIVRSLEFHSPVSHVSHLTCIETNNIVKQYKESVTHIPIPEGLWSIFEIATTQWFDAVKEWWGEWARLPSNHAGEERYVKMRIPQFKDEFIYILSDSF